MTRHEWYGCVDHQIYFYLPFLSSNIYIYICNISLSHLFLVKDSAKLCFFLFERRPPTPFLCGRLR